MVAYSETREVSFHILLVPGVLLFLLTAASGKMRMCGSADVRMF